MQFKFVVLLYSAVALTPLAASAQQPMAKPHPADPNAAAPAAQYESAFAGYMPYRDEKLASWRDVNDEAARVGGHLGIFGGAGHGGQTSAKPATKPQASGSMPGIVP
ncbi:MAG: hypothetical protein AABZ67_11415 [Pseudomonadota bacterium]